MPPTLTAAVTKVEFFQNGAKLGEDTASPFNYTWSNVPVGVYTLTAVATDDDGATEVSAGLNLTVSEPNTTSTNVLIALGSDWKYLDDGSDQGTGWSALDFADSGWAEGPAQLGYGDGDEATVVSYGSDPGNKYPTTYFRRFFTVDDPSLVENLAINLLRDDGAVAYINGQEVYRISMPDGPIDYTTYADTAADYDFVSTTLSPTALVAGTNVMAVEIHQGNGSSSDISFDLELSGVVAAPTNFKPVINITAPIDGLTVAAPAKYHHNRQRDRSRWCGDEPRVLCQRNAARFRRCESL